MLMKIKKEDTPVCGQKAFRFLRKMSKSVHSCPYQKMESEAKEKKKSKLVEKKADDCSKGKENCKTLTKKEAKDKKPKKKGWKRVRQVALTTCRYIGMGAAHMSPATAYAYPDYCMDPKVWNSTYSYSKKSKIPPHYPHWSTTCIYAGW